MLVVHMLRLVSKLHSSTNMSAGVRTAHETDRTWPAVQCLQRVVALTSGILLHHMGHTVWSTWLLATSALLRHCSLSKLLGQQNGKQSLSLQASHLSLSRTLGLRGYTCYTQSQYQAFIIQNYMVYHVMLVMCIPILLSRVSLHAGNVDHQTL